MYKTPMRRGLSPDTPPVLHSDSSRSSSRSWSRGRSPTRRGRSRSRGRSPARRSRSRSQDRSPARRSRSRSQGRSPARRSRSRSQGRSPARRSRSPSRAPARRSRFRSQGRSRSPGRSPARRSRSRSPGRSPARRSRSRSPGRSPARRSRSRSPGRSPALGSRSRGRSRPRHATKHRSKSRSGRSRSPRRRSPSPRRRSPSRRRHSTTPRRSPSPRRHSTTSRRSPSPRRHSTTPRRSPSPRRHSTTPRRSPSPRRHSTTPRRSPSPRRHSTTPRRSPSPRRHSTTPRRSPSPRYTDRNRSSLKSKTYEDCSREQDRYSPSDCYRSPDHPPASPSADRSASGHEATSSIYKSSSDSRPISGFPYNYPSLQDRRPGEPLPMPKKSILKKRTEPEATRNDQSPRVDNSSNKDLTDLKSSPAPVRTSEVGSKIAAIGPSKTNLPQITTSHKTPVNQKPSPILPAHKMSSISNPPLAGMKTNSPLVTGSNPSPATPMGRTLTTAKQGGTLANADNVVKTPQHDNSENKLPTANVPKRSQNGSMGDFLDMFNKSACETRVPFNPTRPFLVRKEEVKTPDVDNLDRFLLPHEHAKDIECKLSPPVAKENISSSTPDKNQRSTSEIEDEERFLYGDEDNKKTDSEKVSSSQTSSVAAPAEAPNKQEFEKIHDLLKTIGLDIGLAEIGQLADRTHERLHGKKWIQKIPQAPAQQPQGVAKTSPVVPKLKTAQPPVTTEKKEKDLTKPTAKIEKAAKPVQPVKEQTPPIPQPSKPATKAKTPPLIQKPVPKEQAIPSHNVEIPMQPPTISYVPEPISPAPQVPLYPPYSPTPIVQTYSIPPPNYIPYSPYPTYPPSNWPMYPPVHKVHMPAPVAPPIIYNPRSNLLIIETTKEPVKSEVRPSSAVEDERMSKQEADRRSETEKIKVMEELNELQKVHQAKTENLKTLSTKVEQLSIHQGLLLQKKQREKAGHKDPLLEELNTVLSSAQKQITSLCQELEDTKEKKQKLIKLAGILGVSPTELAEWKETSKKREWSPGSPVSSRGFDSESKASSDSKTKTNLKSSTDPVPKIDKLETGTKPGSDIKLGDVNSSASSSDLSSSTVKSDDSKRKSSPPKSNSDLKVPSEPSSSCSSKTQDISMSQDESRSKSPKSSAPPSKTSPNHEEPAPFDTTQIFEYCDFGGHWCESCNLLFMTLPEFLLHLHDKQHSEKLEAQKTPWVKERTENSVKTKLNVTLRGPEFMHPTCGYYCEICKELFPDHKVAVEHVKAYPHNEKYEKYLAVNINYEKLRLLKKNAGLIAAQETARRQREQKRKANEQHEQSKTKKVKKQEEERERNVKRKSSLSPAKSDQKRNTIPDKGAVKSTAVGKHAWKTSESKSHTVSSTPKVEAAAKKDQDDEVKGHAVTAKGTEIKLCKPSNTQESPRNSTSSSSTESITSTVSTCTPSSSTTTSSTFTTQTKVQPDLPDPTTHQRTPSVAPISKPAPLNTFLSIKSSSTSSKAIPVLKGKPAEVFLEDLDSKVSAGQLVSLKETKESVSKPEPVSTVKLTETSSGVKPNHEKTKITKKVANNELLEKRKKEQYDMFFNKKTVSVDHNTAAKKGRATAAPTKLVDSSSKKSSVNSSPTNAASSSNPSHKVTSNPSDLTKKTGTVKDQHVQVTKSSTQSASHVAPVKTCQPPINTAPGKMEPPKAVTIPNSSTKSTSQVETGKNIKASITPLTSKPGYTHSQEEKGINTSVQKPSDTNAPSKPKEITTQFTCLSMNPVTGKLEYIPLQETKTNKETIVPKPLEKKPVVTIAPSVKPTSVPAVKLNPIYSATTKLNQKFKRAPLSLPSLFGHTPDIGYIKISSAGAQKSTKADNYAAGQQPHEQNKVTIKTSPTKDLQHELDSYYKLIATEDDPEDLTTSEDQEMEDQPVAISATVQMKVENPRKNIKLEHAQPHTKTPIKAVIPVESCEDLDDSDMACEVPDVSMSAIAASKHKPFGQSLMSSGYASSQLDLSATKQPVNISYGKSLVDKDYSKTIQEKTPPVSDYSMDDLSVLTTCDSD